MSTLSHYHKNIRKITSAFSSLFNNILFIKEDEDGSEIQRQIVPLEYGDKEKFVKRIQGDIDLNKKVQLSLPRMSYIMNGFSYDASRKLNTNNKNFASNPASNDSVFMQYNPVPYDLDYNLYIYTRNVEDGNQIIEQILPYFTPDYSLRVDLVPGMNMPKVLPIILNRADQHIDSTGEFSSEVRSVIWTLSFSVKGFIFGAVKDVKIIKEISINVSSSVGEYVNNYLGNAPCNPSSKSFIMDTGCRDYLNGEIVYQGQNLELSYATGAVKSWSNTDMTLHLIDTMGTFKLNQLIVGTQSFTTRKALSLRSNNILAYTETSTVTPNTANVDSCWTINSEIVEYNA